jgi:hypothetical protein
MTFLLKEKLQNNLLLQENVYMKISKIALLVLQLTMLVAFVSYTINLNYHSHTLLAGLPLYAFGLITALLILFYGINALKKPLKITYLNFLIVSVVPNVFLVWTIVKCVKNYTPQLLPIVVFAGVILVTYIINIILYSRIKTK